MDERFQQLRKGIIQVITHKPREHDEVMAEILLEVWLDLHQRGVTAFDFAHASLLMADAVMTHYESEAENVAFGEYLQKAGARKIRIFSEGKQG